MDKHIISSYQPDATHGPFACIKKTMNDNNKKRFLIFTVKFQLLLERIFGHRQVALNYLRANQSKSQSQIKYQCK